MAAIQKCTKGIPLVRVHSLSSDVQQDWLKAKSYDRKTGNPSIARHDAIILNKSITAQKEREKILCEVESLSDDTNTKGTRQKETYLLTAKSKRHEEILSQMNDTLLTLCNKYKSDISSLCNQLKMDTSNSYIEIEKLLSERQETVLVEMSYKDIEDLMCTVNRYNHKRRKWLAKFEEELLAIEQCHMKKISEVLNGTLSQLCSVSYLMTHQLNDIIRTEALKINLAILNNRKCYSKLCKYLTQACSNKGDTYRQTWEELVRKWKNLKCNEAEKKFKEFIESDEITNPSDLIKLNDELVSKQDEIRQRLEKHLEQLSSTASPPQVAKAKIYEWRNVFVQLHSQLGQSQSYYCQTYHKTLESIFTTTENKIDIYRNSLIDELVLLPVESEQFVTEKLIPHLNHYQNQCRNEFRKIEKSLSSLHNLLQSRFTAMFQFAQGATHIWDTHLLKLSEISRQYESQLIKLRNSHDLDNQTIEANLDYVLDRLRQSGTKIELNEYLKMSLELLGKIKSGYLKFHETMAYNTQTCVPQVKEELDLYEASICQYLGVGRVMSQVKRKGRGSSQAKSRNQKRASSTSPLHTMLEQVITADGTSFYIIKHESDARGHCSPISNVFLTQDEDVEISMETFATQSLTIPDSKYTDIKERCRLAFLNHLEIWKKEKSDEVKDLAQEKNEEHKTELELCLHLHEPRPKRIKNDIYDVREVELNDHEERLTKHIKGIGDLLHKLKDSASKLWETLDDKISCYSSHITVLNDRLTTCNTTLSLKKVYNDTEAFTDKVNMELNELLDRHIESMDNDIIKLTTSNNEYLLSLKLFSDGGNYSSNEIQIFQPKLEKQNERIIKYSEKLRDEIFTIREVKNERIETIRETSFTNDYENHLIDLNLLESIKQTFVSCQVKIKTEVLVSNGQSKEIDDQISALKSNKSDLLDNISCLYTSLSDVLQLIYKRVQYLYCHSSKSTSKSREGSNVCISKAPISAIDVSKSIISYVDGRRSTIDDTNLKKSRVMPNNSEQLKQQQHGGRASVLKQKTSQKDRKTVSYGTTGGKDGSECLLPKVRAILNETHSKLYLIAEKYYQQKGSSDITRPDSIADNFKQCMDNLIDCCHSYREQAETYRISCIDELHVQIGSLMSLSKELPHLVFERIASQSREEMMSRISENLTAVATEMSELNKLKESYEFMLRPSLGHPDSTNELDMLCNDESIRHTKVIDTITNRHKLINDTIRLCMEEFLYKLQYNVDNLLKVYDEITVDEDIISATAKAQTHQELMIDYVQQGRLTNKVGHDEVNSTLHDIVPVSVSKIKSRLIIQWSSINCSTIANDSIAIASQSINEKVTSERNTAAHVSVIKARDDILQEYINCVNELVSEATVTQEKELQQENKHYTTWQSSVDAIKLLYTITQ